MELADGRGARHDDDAIATLAVLDQAVRELRVTHALTVEEVLARTMESLSRAQRELDERPSSLGHP